MAFIRRWFLILFALLAGGGPAFAASREERAYAAAVQAFNDHFYSVAEARLANFLQNYRRSTNAPMAVLLLAQSEFYQNNFSAVASLGDTNNLAKAKAAGLTDRYVYWQAEAQFAQGDLENAAQTFVSLTEHHPGSLLALNATVEAASAFAKLGRWPETGRLLDNTNGFFQRVAQLDPANERVSDGRLLQAESRYQQQEYTNAINTLKLLVSAMLTPEQDWKRAHLLYLANLGLNDLDAALAATTNLLQVARLGRGEIWATNLAESVACHADVLEQQNRLAEAAAAWQENLSTNVPAGQQQHTLLKLADLAVAQKNLTNAETTLGNFLTQFPDSPAAEIARLTLGELHLKDYIAQPSATNHLTLAQANLDQFLAVTTDGPLAGKAFLDRGWCAWLWGEIAAKAGDTNNPAAEKYAESLTNFQAAAEPGRLPMSADLAVARFKMGDAQFVLTNYSDARSDYEAVLKEFSAVPQVTNSLASRALYQILRADLALQETNGMDDVMQQLLGKFFMSAPAESGMLLAGEAFSDFDFPAKARDIFSGFKVEHGDSPLMPAVAFAIGRTYEREQNWPAAVTNYEAWLKTYPDPAGELWPQVAYARAWAVSQAGDEGRAFNLFTNFTGRCTNSLTPLADWWVADHYFRLGTNYMDAEKNYELIFQNFPTNELACKAQFMAGRAAMGRGGDKDAKRYFTELLDPRNVNCTEDLQDQARFGLCDVLHNLSVSETNNASLLEATIYLAQMYARAETNIVRALAYCKTGDIDFQMGALDLATNAYAQVLSSPAASQELRDRALVGWGGVLEKKAENTPVDARNALLELAMKKYEAVFDPDADVNADAEDTSEWWIKEAGLKILALNAKIGSLKGRDLDKIINKMEVYFPQLKDSLEQKRLALKS